MRLHLVLRAAVAGLLLGSSVTLLLAGARWFGFRFAPYWPEFVLPFTWALLAAWFGLRQSLAWQDVAGYVDRQFCMQDRVLTAWSFSVTPIDQLTGLQRLQITDALRSLEDVDLSTVARVRMPHLLVRAVALWGLAILVGLVPVTRQAAVAQRHQQEQLQQDFLAQEVATELERQVLSELQQLQRTVDKDPVVQLAMKELVENVREQLERLKQPGQSQRDLLATLSAVQAEFTKTDDVVDAAHTGDALKSIGKTLSEDIGLMPLSEALDRNDFRQAAETLDAWDPTQLSDLDARTLAEKLNTELQVMRDRDVSAELQEAAIRLQAGLEQRDDAVTRQGSKGLAMQMRQQALRADLQRDLEDQLTRIAEAKSVSLNGGTDVNQTEQSRETWGGGRPGDPLTGQANDFVTNRHREQLKGAAGEGPSYQESTRSDQLTGTTQRDLGANPQIQAGAVEEALRHELLPLGHRRTVRRYFQTLRGQNASRDPDSP